MKKFLVIFLIFMLWPFSAKAAENQSIIFSGSYSINNEIADADSAWLYLAYYDVDVDSVLVSAQSEGWGGWYRYVHTCTNDSVWGWSGRWVYITNAASIRLGEDATVTIARDSSYALHTQVDSLKDTTEDMSIRLLATGFSTFDPTSDSVLITMAVLFARMAADSVPVNLLPGVIDSASFDTASMREHYETFFSTDTDIDSILLAITDANKVNFQSDGDTNTNPFDNANDKVTLVDTSADGIHDAEIAALDALDSANVIHQKLFFQGLVDSSGGGSSPWSEAEVDSILNAMADANKENFKADVSGLSTLTDTELRAALGDSLYSERMNSLETLLIEVKGYSLDLAYYWGACDGCYYRLYPEGGSPNKDSAIIIDPSLGADSLVGKVIYLHGTDEIVVDTAYFYRDEPW